MGIFPLFKKKEFFSAEEKERIMSAIRLCEKTTSGEIIVYVESHNPMVDPLDRAKEIFFKKNMQRTRHRNAVLLYLAVKDRELALYGDEGIHEQAFENYWAVKVKEMLEHFREESMVHGIVHCIAAIGETLKDKFPYDANTDENELPDDIIFGR